MQAKNAEDLLERYNNGLATDEERALVESWYLKHKTEVPGISHRELDEAQKESLAKLLVQIDSPVRKRFSVVYAAAASVLLLLSAGIFFLVHRKPNKQLAVHSAQAKQDIAPGDNKAILTLANGDTVVLTGAKNGLIASQGNIMIRKTASGQISYIIPNADNSSTELLYNTATTPRGGQYQFILSDGTNVWLNSASSIKYPVSFVGNERRVEITGEAYFEVAHDAKKPFRVVTSGQVTEVLGTHFNINAYSDEDAIKTTLLEGSVKVISTAGTKVIKPGEQVQYNNGSVRVIEDVDVDAVVSWKNGLFHFEDNNIHEVMRQLARWYDVDIKYRGQLPDRQFSGEISRNINASQIMDILSFKKIHYIIDGKSIIITP